MPPKLNRIPLPIKKSTIDSPLPSITGAIKKTKRRSKSIGKMTHKELENNAIQLQKELNKLSLEGNKLQLERDKWNEACHISKKRIEELSAEKVNKATRIQKVQDEIEKQNELCRKLLKEQVSIYENRKNELEKYYETCFSNIQRESLDMEARHQRMGSELLRPIEEQEKKFKRYSSTRDDLINDDLEAAESNFTEVVREFKEKAENYLPSMTRDHELYVRVQAFNNIEQTKLGVHNLMKMLNEHLDKTKNLFNDIVKRDIVLILLLKDLEYKFGARTDIKKLEDEVQAEKNTEYKLLHEIKETKEEIMRFRSELRREKRELREMEAIKEKIETGTEKIQSTGLGEKTLLQNYLKAKNDLTSLQDQLKRAPKIFQELYRKTGAKRQQEMKSLMQQAEEMSKQFEMFTSSQCYTSTVVNSLQTSLKANRVEIDKMTDELNSLKKEKSKTINSYNILYNDVKKRLQSISKTEESKLKMKFVLERFNPTNIIGDKNLEMCTQNNSELQVSKDCVDKSEVFGVTRISLDEPGCSKTN